MTLRPITYEVQNHPFRSSITIQARIQRGYTMWVCTLGESGSVLNTDGQFEYEPLPSNRADDFIARTRFRSPAEALENLERHIPNFEPHWFKDAVKTLPEALAAIETEAKKL